jgi:hypothetical protein
VLSLTAIEMGLAGFGLEMLADVTHGGAWHIGVLAALAESGQLMAPGLAIGAGGGQFTVATLSQAALRAGPALDSCGQLASSGREP